MDLRDNDNRFGLISIVLHWLVAALIVTTICVALYADSLPRDEGRTWRFLHVSLGMLLAPVVAARVIWRFTQGKPATRHHAVVEQRLAGIVWRVLLIAPVVLLATGPFLAWLHERPIGFFGLFEIHSPVAPDRDLRKAVVFPLHAFFGYAIIVAIALHVAGALKHLLVYRDGVAERMLRPFKRAPRDAAGNDGSL